MQREGVAGFKHIARFFYASDDLAGSREDSLAGINHPP